MEKRVLLLSDMTEEGKEILREAGCEVRLAILPDTAARAALMREWQPQAIVTKTDVEVTADMMDAAPSLRCVSRYGVGVDNIDVEAATARGIRVVHVVDGNYTAVAEHAMFLMLALAKRYGTVGASMRRGEFGVKYELFGDEISGKTLGILGTGHIGKALAKMASGFSMHVLGWSRHVKAGTVTEEGMEIAASREDVFRAADFLVIAMPSTPETRGSIGTAEFALMKRSAFFVNVSRGNIVREAELIRALQEGELAGAGLDVFETEPAAADNPLLHMENVITTPHFAANTKEAARKLSIRAAEGAVDVLEGREPLAPVN